MNRKPIFDAVRKLLARPLTQDDVTALDKAIDLATGALPASEGPIAPAAPAAATPTGMALGKPGKTLIQKWEGCHRLLADGAYLAYPDPGSKDGKPWTIGWGSTGPDIKKGTVWTRAQCDARFDTDMLAFTASVSKILGDAPTTQNQFDALVSFHYNTGALGTATLTKLHKEGRYTEAAAEFGKWIYNDGKPMLGLKNRRADEAKLYQTA